MPRADRSDRRYRRDRGLSEGIGILLTAAIALAIAAILAGAVMGFPFDLKDPAPQGAYTTEFHPDGADNHGYPYFVLTFEGGPTSDASKIYVRDESGNEVTWESVWTGGPEVAAAEYVHIDGYRSDGALDRVCEKGQRYHVVVRNDEGESFIVMRFEVPVEPNPPPGWC